MSRTLKSRLVLKVHPDTEKKLDSGIIIPGISYKDLPGVATVHQVGPDCVCVKGDRVLFSRAAAVPVEIAGVDYVTLIEDPNQILVILEEGE